MYCQYFAINITLPSIIYTLYCFDCNDPNDIIIMDIVAVSFTIDTNNAS